MNMMNVMKIGMKMNREDDEGKEKKLGVGGSLFDTIHFTRFNGLDFEKIIKRLKFKILLKFMVDHYLYWCTLESHMSLNGFFSKTNRRDHNDKQTCL
ncbi:unnamed protein product [Trifolium pratense]|uniref:Uncharacterized protein n=1 Tax=Trifolium pratense TaxID=57577 RepID=A0ACB0J1Q1_TRIPR|nr:unnamed protein product [Trifolium pratense]